jgi:YbaB/EbfC DNA-binding family
MRDLMQDVAVSGSSPDGSVTVTATGSPARIGVAIARDSTRGLTHREVEQRINAAVRVALVAYQQAATRAWEVAAGVDEAPR